MSKCDLLPHCSAVWQVRRQRLFKRLFLIILLICKYLHYFRRRLQIQKGKGGSMKSRYFVMVLCALSTAAFMLSAAPAPAAGKKSSVGSPVVAHDPNSFIEGNAADVAEDEELTRTDVQEFNSVN
jgi:hypothetical protein